jgi:hypothetical protein
VTLTKTPRWCARTIPRPRSFTNWSQVRYGSSKSGQKE